MTTSTVLFGAARSERSGFRPFWKAKEGASRMKELGRGAWGMITNCECVWIGNVRLWYCPDEFTLMIDVPRNLDEAWRSYLALFFFPVSCEDQALAVEMQTLRYEGQGVEDIPLLLEMIRSFAQQVPIRRLAIVC